MNDEEIDLRLRQAVGPLVTEAVPASIALDPVGVHVRTTRRAAGGSLVGALALLLVIALAGAYRLSGIAGSAVTEPSASPDLQTVAGGPRTTTVDGQVFVQRSANGMNLELVLQKDPSTMLVLASFQERVPGSNESFSSIHLVDCPPATGLEQRYYAFGQETATGTITLHGIAATASTVSRGMYVIAVKSLPKPADRWTFTVGATGNGGGSLGSSFLLVQSSGDKSAAGCYVDPM